MMKLVGVARASLMAAGLGAFGAVGPAQALTTFDLIYDGIPDGVLAGPFVGFGTVSYDDPVSTGSFALSSLTNLSITIGFITGDVFTLADIATDPDFAFIDVFDIGGGEFGMVFSGTGDTSAFGGSLDFETLDALVTHEPYDVGVPCCGGSGEINLYGFENFAGGDFFGDYGVVELSAIPLPATALPLGAGLAGLGFAARRRAA